jgi:hypothetical protein
MNSLLATGISGLNAAIECRGIGADHLPPTRSSQGEVMGMTADELDRLVSEPSAEENLRTYFGTCGSSIRYSGRLFDRLSHDGGNRSPNRVTPDDLIAVQMLSVVVDRDVAFEILSGDLGNKLERLLAAIDPKLSIDDPEARTILNDPATKAWKLLEGQGGVGWVTAGKLLASKRPRLIPVYDTVVRCVTRPGKSKAWLWFADMLGSNERGLIGKLETLRAAADVGEHVSLLRTLDVVIWMRHKDAHKPSHCVGLAT